MQAKKARTSEPEDVIPGGGTRDANGDAFWEIADRRRMTVSEFKGKTMVSIREYYEKDGQVLPGKKVWPTFFSSYQCACSSILL
jgi:Transcriptional Coactivator p15 (PC4)